MANFAGSNLLQSLVDRFKLDTSPVQIHLSADVVLGCHPITAEVEHWIDKGVDHTNRLTIVHTLAPRTLALATSTINGQPVYKELGLDLRRLGIGEDDLNNMSFCSWPIVVRETIAEALFEYLSQLPSSILDGAYSAYLAQIEDTVTAEILESIEVSVRDQEDKNIEPQDSEVNNSSASKEDVQIAFPEEDIPGVRTASVGQVASGK